ncbi:hypothetical protein TNCV_3306821 [Trichonephila clavipes]|nr:hypothetical protein TNCV_3306821 [Trichonephila clavipes]
MYVGCPMMTADGKIGEMWSTRGYQSGNRDPSETFSQDDRRNRGLSENFSRGTQRQGGRLIILKVQDDQVEQSQSLKEIPIRPSAICMSSVELLIIICGVKLAEFNIGWGHRSGTKNAVADILPKNPVESSAAENVACAIIRDMRLSSREQLTEE